MAQVTIQDVYNAAPAAALSDGDLVEIQQGADTKGATYQQVREFIRAHLESNPLAVPHVVVNASRTLALTDANTELQCDAATAITLTIPANATVAFDRGTKIAELQLGTGAVTITAEAGVTLNGVSGGSATISAQYKGTIITSVGTDAWVLNGDHGSVA